MAGRADSKWWLDKTEVSGAGGLIAALFFAAYQNRFL